MLEICGDEGITIEAAHCNFHLRGDESDRDEAFCIELCKRFGVELHRVHFDTKEYARLHKQSIELAARNLRYSYFAQLAKDIGAEGILVAHHEDDNIETILMNLMRGTGTKGLRGIQPKRDNIIRPLLCISRNDIETWLRERGQDYVTDSTNMVADVTRNKIRLQLLPLMEEINPDVRRNILTTARNLSYPEEEQEMFEKLRPLGFSSAVIKDIYDSENTGAVFTSNDGKYDAVISSEGLKVERHYHPIRPLIIPEEGNYIVRREEKENKEYETVISIRLSDDTSKISKDAAVVTLDAAKVPFPLKIRQIQEGDRFVPFGMTGSRLLSDFLTDMKVDVLSRRRQLVLEDAEGKIVWVIGKRPNNRCRITASTVRSLVISISRREV